MPWAGLDDGFHEDPRIIEAGLAAAGLYACCTTYCARHLTDGYLPAKAVGRLLDDGDAGPVSALVKVGLLRLDKRNERYEVVGYLSANRTRVQVDEAKAKAKSAAQARWSKAADAPSIADALPSPPRPSTPLQGSSVTETAKPSTH